MNTTRWRITGEFTTRSPLHVGSGATTARPELTDPRDGSPNDVQAVAKDFAGEPCIPGTALKGVLRAWAETFFPGHPAVERLFGRDSEAADAESGWAEFCTVTYVSRDDPRDTEFVPYWCPNAVAGVYSSVCIDRHTGAARAGKLFFQEFVPEGVTFRVEVRATRVKPEEVALLLAVLEAGASHASHPYQFGANGADGWGRVAWTRTAIENRAPGQGWVAAELPQPPPPTGEVKHEAIGLTLTFAGPFLVNDASHTRRADAPEGDRTPHFAPLRKPDGAPWLPASSFRGALRARAEFLLRSTEVPTPGEPPNGDLSTDPRIERLFGSTGRASRLTIDDFTTTKPGTDGRQDFVAIDRFTGGAADGALFTAEPVVGAEFRTRLTLDLDGTKPQDCGLFAAALRDVCAGVVTIGMGGSKGYGDVRGELDPDGRAWLEAQIAQAPVLAARPQPAAAPANPPAPAADVKQGTLVWQGEGKKRKQVLQVPTNKLPYQLHDAKVLKAGLWGNPTDAIPVDYESGPAGQPVRIRPHKETWAAAAAGPQPGRFANPYYFLPHHDRVGFTGDLADAAPRGHARYFPDRYSGTIRVRLTTETPLLLCDAAKAYDHPDGPSGHRVYPVLLRDGKPLLASSSVRGMLRAAFEGVTNSRFGVFPGKESRLNQPAEQHGRRLGHRLPASAGLNTVPARIRHDPNSSTGLSIELLPGTSTVTSSGLLTPGNPVFAAWCGAYGWKPTGFAAVSHRSSAWAYLTPWHYQRVLPSGKVIDFDFWNVEELATSATKPTGSPPTAKLRGNFGRAAKASWAKSDWYSGHVCINLRNMQGKHDERFFFTSSSMPLMPLENDHLQQWRQLVENYQEQHTRELMQGLVRPPVLNPPNVFSRHISAAPPLPSESERTLRADDLCYAEVAFDGTRWVVKGLYPVMISRKLYNHSPLDLLPKKLHPAKVMTKNDTELSPADRVFGWVSQDAPKDTPDPAYRSQVRVGVVECLTEDAVVPKPPAPGQPKPEPKALAILGQPQPQQGRFYLGKTNGHGSTAQSGATKEQAGYNAANRVRGPKVYPHHKFDEANATVGERGKQNRSVEGWVKPGSAFEFDLHVTNLSGVELGALVWLLTLGEGHFLGLGLGKPLGFGSVRAEIAGGTVADGAAWSAANNAWTPAPAALDPAALKAEFVTAMNAANKDLLPAFLRAAKGFDGLPVHYPIYQGEHYEWFVQNDKSVRKAALPDLCADNCSLPIDPI